VGRGPVIDDRACSGHQPRRHMAAETVGTTLVSLQGAWPAELTRGRPHLLWCGPGLVNDHPDDRGDRPDNASNPRTLADVGTTLRNRGGHRNATGGRQSRTL